MTTKDSSITKQQQESSEVKKKSRLAFILIVLCILACSLLIKNNLDVQYRMLQASGLSFEQRILLQRVGDQTRFLLEKIHVDEMDDAVINQIRGQISLKRQQIEKKQIELGNLLQYNNFPLSIFTSKHGDYLEIQQAEQALLLSLDRFYQRIDEINQSSIPLLKAGYNYLKPADMILVSGGALLTTMETLNDAIYRKSLLYHKLLQKLYGLMLFLVLTGFWSIWLFLLLPLITRLQKQYDEVRSANHHLQHQAVHDHLTGIPNRMAFNAEIQQVFQQQTALILIDIDNFKAINDTFGHQVGDLTLIDIAQHLQTAMRSNEHAYRLSGDEFALIIYDNQDRTYLEQRAESIISLINKNLSARNGGLSVSVSLGIAWGSHSGTTFKEIFGAADMALYYVKQHKRNDYAFYEDISESNISEVIALEEALSIALSERQFLVYYQPIIDIRTQRIVRLEALARWQHPLHGVLQPKSWLPLAEKLTLLSSINLQIFDQVERDLHRWLNLGLTPVPVNVNVTENMLSNGAALQRVMDMTASGKLPSRLVAIEITESIVLDRSFSRINEQLNRMAEHGIKISLDDFGTGFANLSHLHEIPFHTIKIDQSFVSKIVKDEAVQQIIDTIISLGKKLKKDIVFEGVDHIDISNKLLEMGGVYSQGFLYSKPVAFECVSKWLFNNHRFDKYEIT